MPYYLSGQLRLAVAATLAILVFVPLALAAPTASSGINTSDTWVTMNLAVQPSISLKLPNSVYSASTKSYVTAENFNLTARHYYLEAGFDTNNLLVVNIQPTDTATDRTTSFYSGTGKISVRGGRLFLYDASNNPIPVVMPDGTPVPEVLPFLGLSPGASVLSGIIINSPPTTAQWIPGTLSYPQSNLAKIVSTSSIGTSSSKTLTYVQSGSVWILQTVKLVMSTSNRTVSQVIQTSNVAWYDNTTRDSQRATKRSTLVRYPPAGTLSLNPYTVPSATSVTPSDQLTTGATGSDVVFQHGIFSSGSTWNRMVPWLQSDFHFANVQTPSLNSTDHLASQAGSLTNLVQSTGISSNIVIGHSQGASSRGTSRKTTALCSEEL